MDDDIWQVLYLHWQEDSELVYVFFLRGELVGWSMLQDTVALSTIEAECSIDRQ